MCEATDVHVVPVDRSPSSSVASRCETFVAVLSAADPHVRVGVLGPAEQLDDDVVLTVQI